MLQLPVSSHKVLKQLKNVPPIINISRINNITDISYLLALERKYDKFLEANMQLLDLYNIIDDLIDIRNAAIIQIGRLKRKMEFSEYNMSQTQEKVKKGTLLDTTLNLTSEQKAQDYIPCHNTLKEYKCGCKTLQYKRQHTVYKQNQIK